MRRDGEAMIQTLNIKSPMKTLYLWAILLLLSAVVTGCGKKASTNSSGALEATEIDIVSTIPARIASVRANLGDNVNAGDTVVVLDTELLRLQRVQIAASRQTLRAQRDVTGDQMNQARTNLRLAESSLERTRALFQQGSATEQQLDELLAKRDISAAQVSAAKNQLVALTAEEEKLDATLAVLDRQLQEGLLYAPISGTVILRSVEPGEMASPGSALLRIANLTKLDLRVFLSETDVGKVKIGQQLPVLVDALPNESFTGAVTWISPEAEFTPKNAQTREARTQLVYAVKLSVNNPNGRLHIGMPVEVKLPQ